jgi:hypothetical protein
MIRGFRIDLVKSILTRLAEHTNTEADAERVRELVQLTPEEDRLSDQTINFYLGVGMQFIRRHFDDLKLWLDNYQPGVRLK